MIFSETGGLSLIEDSDLITVLNKSDILNIEIPNDRSFFDNCLFSSYTGGALVGLLAGIIATLVSKNKSDQNVAPALIAMIGWAIGTVIAYFMFSSEADYYEIDGDFDLGNLKEYARFKNFEPMYLRQIE